MPHTHEADAPVPTQDERLPVAIVYGTPSETTKLEPLWRTLDEHSALRPVLIFPGQLPEMAEPHAWLGMAPDVNFAIKAEDRARTLAVA